MADWPGSPRKLDYQLPSSQESRPIFLWSFFVVSLILVLFASIFFLFVIPKFELIFKDFNAKLPAATIWLIRYSRSFQWLGLWLLPPLIGFLPVVFPPEWSEPKSMGRRYITTGCVLLLILVVVIPVVLLFIPIVSLINATSGK